MDLNDHLNNWHPWCEARVLVCVGVLLSRARQPNLLVKQSLTAPFGALNVDTCHDGALTGSSRASLLVSEP